jgi:hypothetical protein
VGKRALGRHRVLCYTVASFMGNTMVINGRS